MKELVKENLVIKEKKTFIQLLELIGYLKENYSKFISYEISILNDLRILRNCVAYGDFLLSRLNRNESLFNNIIQKLEGLIKRKL